MAIGVGIEKMVEPKVGETLSGRRNGNNAIAMSAHLHYGLGSTTSQILEILNYHFSVNVTPRALFDLRKCAAEILTPWYEEIRFSCLSSGVLHTDESGWRVNGNTHWLWRPATKNETYYMIHPTRGEQAVNEFFAEYFDGVLISDFYAVYNYVEYLASQKCLVHLLRDLKGIELYKDIRKT